MRRTKSIKCDLDSLEQAALNELRADGNDTPDFSRAPLLEEPDFSRQNVSPENPATRTIQPKALSFEQIRQMAENGPLTDLLIHSESNNGGLLYLEAINMHRTFLDEWNRDRAFVSRCGAFGYEEVQAVCRQALQRYEEIASIPTLPAFPADWPAHWSSIEDYLKRKGGSQGTGLSCGNTRSGPVRYL